MKQLLIATPVVVIISAGVGGACGFIIPDSTTAMVVAGVAAVIAGLITYKIIGSMLNSTSCSKA